MYRLILLLALFTSAPTFALDKVYEFNDDSQRQTYQRLTEELRCPKCPNQNLSDSDSEIAESMRDVIFESLQEGRSESEIKSLMVDRYGDFVLYEPPVTVETLVLWWAPLVFMGLALCSFIVIVVKRRKLNK